VPIVLLLIALVSLIQPTLAQTPPLPGDFMGMVVRDPHYEWKTNPAYPDGTNQAFFDEMGRNLQTAGVKWVRIEFFAEEHAGEHSDLRGRVDVEKYRYFINTVAPRHGLKVLALLATPLVRRPADDTRFKPTDDDPDYPVGAYISPERLEDSLRDQAGTNPVCASKRFGSTNPYMCIWLRNAFTIASAFPYDKATGAGIAAYEVLNEENRYLGGGGKGLNPLSVATLLTKFYRVMKKERGPDGSLGAWVDDVKILLGGIHPDRCNDCGKAGLNDRQYLDAVYRSPTVASFRNTHGHYPLDGVGFHPYPMEMRSGLLPEHEPTAYHDLHRVPARVQAIRNVMLENGDSANKIWVTEVGDRGAPRNLEPDGRNEARQADFMRTMYWMLWQQRAVVETVLWFKYEDFAVPREPADAEGKVDVGPENWGVVRLESRPLDQYQCGICEYEANGVVQVYKQSFATFANMANSGIGLQTYVTYLPHVGR